MRTYSAVDANKCYAMLRRARDFFKDRGTRLYFDGDVEKSEVYREKEAAMSHAMSVLVKEFDL